MHDQTQYFYACIYPYRSLSRDGFRVLLIVLLCMFCVLGVLFLVSGAWPVVGLMGLELVALYIGFRVSYAQAKSRETLEVRRNQTELKRFDRKGQEIASHIFDTAWLTIEYSETKDDPQPIKLKSKTLSQDFAKELSAPERADLVIALRSALVRATSAVK